MKILFITTVYRIGEKVYPIVFKLAKNYQVDVLNLYQMSVHSQWNGEIDLRQNFYAMCNDFGLNSFSGPSFISDSDTDSKNYIKYFNEIEDILPHYDLAIIDNNITIKGGKMSLLYNWLKNNGTVVVGCPHGNRDPKGYRIHKRIGRHYDYSFVFGKKEQKKMQSFSKKDKHCFISAGIPSNDKLKEYDIRGEYILIIPNITKPSHITRQTKKMKPFTKKVFDDLKILKLADKYACPVWVKEKNRVVRESTFLSKSMKGYPVKFVLDVEDDNSLVCGAKIVISAPSTMAFKPIQKGIPTVLLKGHGMIGNFYDFPGLINPDYKHLRRSIKQQDGQPRNHMFIKNTIEGGIDFSSIDKYLSNIEKLLKIDK